jgi:hypothetical protein
LWEKRCGVVWTTADALHLFYQIISAVSRKKSGGLDAQQRFFLHSGLGGRKSDHKRFFNL